MKLLPVITLVTLGTIATTIKSASAQVGIDPYTGNAYDTSTCYYSNANSCYVDDYGQVYSSDDSSQSGYYTFDDDSWYTQLDQY